MNKAWLVAGLTIVAMLGMGGLYTTGRFEQGAVKHDESRFLKLEAELKELQERFNAHLEQASVGKEEGLMVKVAETQAVAESTEKITDALTTTESTSLVPATSAPIAGCLNLIYTIMGKFKYQSYIEFSLKQVRLLHSPEEGAFDWGEVFFLGSDCVFLLSLCLCDLRRCWRSDESEKTQHIGKNC
jgi:hypothetical protein